MKSTKKVIIISRQDPTVRQLQDFGIVSKAFREYGPQMQGEHRKEDSSGQEEEKLTVTHFLLLFYFLACGMAAGGLTVMGELAWDAIAARLRLMMSERRRRRNHVLKVKPKPEKIDGKKNKMK